MDPRIKQMWVDALRSGKYVQGRNRLHIRRVDGTDTFCCLGVLCDLYHEETGKGEWREDDEMTSQIPAGTVVGFYTINNDCEIRNGGVPPTDVMLWAGFGKNDDPAIYIPEVGRALASLNDAGTPFTTIADFIEKGL